MCFLLFHFKSWNKSYSVLTTSRFTLMTLVTSPKHGTNTSLRLKKYCRALKKNVSPSAPSSVRGLSKKPIGLDIDWHQLASSHGKNTFLSSLNRNHHTKSREWAISLVLAASSCGLKGHINYNGKKTLCWTPKLVNAFKNIKLYWLWMSSWNTPTATYLFSIPMLLTTIWAIL